MRLLYFLSMHFYGFLIRIGSLFNEKAKLWISGRRNIFRNIANADLNGKKIWIHCASLGEFEQGRPIIEKLKKDYPDYKIVLTFFSPSGYEIRKNYELADFICYLPLDTPRNAKRFINLINPEKAIFIKYEFWYFYLRKLFKTGIPIFVASAIFREDHIFFKWYGGFFKKILKGFNRIFVQSQHSLELLQGGGIHNASVCGDTRFDRVATIVENAKSLPQIEKFKGDNKLIIAGSSWAPDEELLLKYFETNNKNLKLIIAPHEVHAENILRIQKLIPDTFNTMLYTEMDESRLVNADILIVNTIGLLSSLYKYADIAHIGGAFGKGLHNTLEAATFGMPIIFGPSYLKFKEAIDLVELKCAFSINDFNEYKVTLDTIIPDSSLLKKLSEKSSQYVKDNRGATDLILKNVMSSER